MSLVEIDVRVTDDTAAGFASVLARYNAMKAQMGDITLGVDLNTTAAMGQLAALQAAAGNLNIGADISGLAGLRTVLRAIGTNAARAQTNLDDARTSLAAFNSEAARTRQDGNGAAVAIGAAGGAAGRFAGFARAAAFSVDLWGGAFKGILPTWLAAAGGISLLTHGIVEFAGVLIPAIVGLVAFGAAAAPTIGDIKTQMQNLNTVVQATGHNLYPLTGGLNAAAAAAKPYVYSLWGDALVIAGSKAGTFATLASSVGSALAVLGARFQLAMTSGNGFGQIMANAAKDVALLGSVIGNIGGIIGALIRAVPGYAQVFLTMANQITGVADAAANTAEPLLHFGLIAHGAFLYAGLAATGFARVVPAVLVGIGNFAANLGSTEGKLASFGAMGARAATGLRSFGVAAAGASALPWGWIAVAAAGLGVLVYWIASAKNATQQWLGSLQATLQAANALHGYSLLLGDQVQVASRLSASNQQLAVSQEKVTQSVRSGLGPGLVLGNMWAAQKQQSSQLAQGLQILRDQTQLYDYRVRSLIPAFGSWHAAQGMLIASGVPMSLMLNKSATALAQVHAMVLATSKAYQSMGQTGGILGADMQVLNRLSSDQYTSMVKLDQAWATFIGRGTGAEQAIVGMIQGMRTVDKEARNAHASFTGVNNASLQLRTNFSSLLGTVQSVVASMRDAKAPASAMAAVIGTELKSAVNAGALQNQIFYQTAASMARQAGYTGNSINSLKGFVDSNAVSTQKLSNITSQYGQNLTKLPPSKHTSVTNTANQASAQIRSYISQLAAIPTSKTTTIFQNFVTIGHPAHAAGGIAGGTSIINEQGPELVRLPQGSMVYSAPDAQRMMGQMGGFGGPPGGGVVALQVLPGGASAFEQFMVEAIRNWVRTAGGGDVQAAFGRQIPSTTPRVYQRVTGKC